MTADGDDTTISERIRSMMARFSPQERKAAHALLANYPVAGLETVAEFAGRAMVSAPTILRFVARLGFSSYPDFQKALRDELDSQLQSPLAKSRFTPDDAGSAPFGRFLSAVIDNVTETFRHLSADEFEAIVALISDRRRKVATIGGRFTDVLARHFHNHLRVVRPGVLHFDGQPSTWRDQLVDLGPRDVLVIFDIRRYQDDLRVLAEVAGRRGVMVVLFTDQWLSPVARHARHIVAARVEALSRWDSMTALLAMAEAVLAAATEREWQGASERIAAIDALRRDAR